MSKALTRSDVIGRGRPFWGPLGRYQRTRTLSAQLPKDTPGLPVNRLAQRLLAEAAASPALVSRTRAPAKLTPKPPADRFPTMALLSDPALDIQQYLEDLVSIAVKSAQQAEDVGAARRGRREDQRGWRTVYPRRNSDTTRETSASAPACFATKSSAPWLSRASRAPPTGVRV